jgi:putative CocE/NonD family hydrolase
MLTGGPADNRPLEARPDVLVFTSEVLREPRTLLGPVHAELHVTSSIDHVDFFVRLCDVHPDGGSFNVCDGLVRLTPELIERDPEGVHRVEVALWPAGHRFGAGHRMRVQVSGGAHPVYARNLGTGEPHTTATTMRAADHLVHHDASRRSSITLPHFAE